jgi:nucleoside-diphosphate-sugar epimerase
VFVGDVVDATMLALERTPQNRVFNVASGTETSILELAKMMQQIVDPAASPHLRFEPSRQGDVHRGVADITRARTELGFAPSTSLSEGLSRTIRWFVHKT